MATLAIVATFCAMGGLFAWLVLGQRSTTPVATLGQAPPGLHTPVRDGQFQFVVTSVSCGHQNVSRGLLNRTAQGQYCLVAMNVSNIGKDVRVFADAFQKAMGPGGTYGTDGAAGFIVNGGGSSWNTVNPGNSVVATIVFDIPTTATITDVELHDGPFSGGVRVSLR
jgi:hypothetical protein